MNLEERRIIRRFAAGEVALRDHSIRIHRKYLSSDKSSPEQLFMREIDTPVPDLALRSKYRQDLLSEET